MKKYRQHGLFAVISGSHKCFGKHVGFLVCCACMINSKFICLFIESML